jgi:hypothetical protein
MPDQPQPPAPPPGGFDVRKVIEQSASKSTLQELAKRGIHRVKVLDEQMINKLIKDAVQQVLVSKTGLVSDADREKIVQASRAELDKLVKEFQQSKDKAELLAKDKDTLAKDVEELQRAVQVQRQLADTLGRQRFEDGRAMARQEIEALKAQLASAEQAARAKLEAEFQKKLSAEMEKLQVVSRQMETTIRSGGEEAVKKAVEQAEGRLKGQFAERERELRDEVRKAAEAAAGRAAQQKEAELKAAYAEKELRVRDEARRDAEAQAKQTIAAREAELRAQFAEREKELLSRSEESARAAASAKEVEFSQKLMAEMQRSADLQAKNQRLLEDMRAHEDELAKKMEQLFTKSIEGLSKKLSDLRLRSIAGGPAVGGDVDAGAFRQSEDVIKHMLSSELESNVKQMEQSEGKTAGSLGSALERLKAMRGGGKPPDKKDDKK